MTGIELVLPAAAACAAAAVTLMTGFGLATVLTPVLLFFYDVKVAILVVAIVHLLNNLLKVSLFRRHIDREVLKRFGILSLLGALLGAFLQGTADSAVVKVVLGAILVILGLKEIVPFGERLRLPRRIDFLGGFLSGLLGGFVGNQGALRSLYLLNYEIPKEAFIATAALIASVVDLTRIPVYVVSSHDLLSRHLILVATTTAAAWGGTIIGKRLVERISAKGFKTCVAGAVAVIGMLLLVKII